MEDERERFFEGGGKKSKAPKDGPSRFKKDLLTYKSTGFKPEDRVIFIGTTRSPDKADKKDFKAFFDKFIFMPYPDYSSRLMLWSKMVQQQVEELTGDQTQTVHEVLDLSTLARISEGFTAGAISRCIRRTLTQRRVARMHKRPIEESEFLNGLAIEASRNQAVYQSDQQIFREFTEMVTG